MRKSWISGAVLFAAMVGCSSKIVPTPATPEMEAEQKRAEQLVRDAEVANSKAEKLQSQTSTPADGELEERAEYERRKREGK